MNYTDHMAVKTIEQLHLERVGQLCKSWQREENEQEVLTFQILEKYPWT